MELFGQMFALFLFFDLSQDFFQVVWISFVFCIIRVFNDNNIVWFWDGRFAGAFGRASRWLNRG
jgi:hypothetical protein